MRRAIYEYVILGVKTTLPLHHALMHHPQFMKGNTHTHFLKDEGVLDTLERYVREEETRMQTLAASLRGGKEIAVVTTAVNAYIAGQAKGRNPGK
jgi:pyruvate carboxylase subunit A